jgi:hypothetical protein
VIGFNINFSFQYNNQSTISVFFENNTISMDKTLHKKLTAKHIYGHTDTYTRLSGNDMLAGLAQEMYILRGATSELLQPRPEAVANILKMARSL